MYVSMFVSTYVRQIVEGSGRWALASLAAWCQLVEATSSGLWHIRMVTQTPSYDCRGQGIPFAASKRSFKKTPQPQLEQVIQSSSSPVQQCTGLL